MAWWPLRRRPLTDERRLFVAAFTLVVTVVVQQPWYTYNLMLLYPPLLGLLAGLTAPPSQAIAPPRGLGWINVAVWLAPWVIYGGLLVVYLAGVLPDTGLEWPGFAALALLTGTLLGGLTILTFLFTYLAWAARGRGMRGEG